MRKSARALSLPFLLVFASFARVQAAPSLVLDKARYASGEAIVATFAEGPGNATDWIGIYPEGVTPSGNPVSTAWYYTNGTQTAGGHLTAGSVTFEASLTPGPYAAWFLENDGYGKLAGPVSFTVDGDGGPPAWLVEVIRPRHAVVGASFATIVSTHVSQTTGPFTFEKTGGPGWLSVSADGALSGVPAAGDAGRNVFTIRATGAGTGLSAEVPVEILVFAAGQESVTRLSVMSYNTWHAWGQVNGGFRKGIESIVRSGADVVGLQESSNDHAQSVAAALGWFRAASGSDSRQLISRYPIVETFRAGNAIGARIQITENPLREVIVYSCHLDYQHYTPYIAEKAGATAADVLAEEARSQRAAQIQEVLAGMSAHLSNADRIPVFLTGDFNTPSHLDWTAETRHLRNGVGPVALPVSTAVENAGMLDSYRVAHPLPLDAPGNTWSPIHKDTEPQDRIDFVYHKGAPLKVLSSETFTTEVQVTIGRWGVRTDPMANNTWPSDHAAVATVYVLAAVDADANGLGDAWENRWFGGLGNDADETSASHGLSHSASQWLGLAPVGPSPPPLALQEGDIVFSLSDQAFGRGLVVERSENLESWETLWAFDSDPFFRASSIGSATPLPPDAWRVILSDSLAEPGDRSGYFRLRWNP